MVRLIHQVPEDREIPARRRDVERHTQGEGSYLE
jgi:hypothetical protein